MRHFVRLIRPINIAIIMITMIGCAYYIHTTNYFQFVRFNAIHFTLLIVSTVLIAAAGNIINDYFDIKADKINKPDRVVIGKFIKKRWAIALHWIFNVIAVLISIYLSIYYQSLWFVFIQVVIVNLLWFYSLYFKKKILIGNFIIALMTGIIPLLVVVFFKVSNESTQAFSSYHASTWTIYVDYSYIYLLAICAFILNLGREIIKDIEDIEGDKKINVYSLPMHIGKKKALWLAIAICQMSFIACLIALLFFNNSFISNQLMWVILFLGIGVTLFLIPINIMKKGFPLKWYSLIIKAILFIGISTLFLYC
jgi:4-hydroxybenzoate polyprenyltransferase